MIIVKWGGSVITNKGSEGPAEVRRTLVRRLAAELAAIARSAPVVLILGAGSFGHPAALAHGIGRRRLTGRRLREAVVAVQSSVSLLRRAVTLELQEAGVAAVEVPGAALAKRGGVDVSPLVAWASAGLVPVTCGDVVPDPGKGIRILSGDEILELAARATRASRAVFVTDVPGVRGPRGIVERIPRSRPLPPLAASMKGDATGGMAGKLAAAHRTARAGVPVLIVGSAPGNLRRAARGGRAGGTLVW